MTRDKAFQVIADATTATALSIASKIIMTDCTLSAEDTVLAVAEGLKRAGEEVLDSLRDAREKMATGGEVPS